MPHPVTLTSARLILREFGEHDADALHAVYGDPVTTEHLSFGPRTAEQIETLLGRIMQATLASPRVDYTLAVCLRGGALIGTARLALGRPDPGGPSAGLDPSSDQAQFGLAVRSDHWGHGYGREVLDQLLSYAFRTLGVTSVWGARSPANLASKALMDDAEFVQTAVIPAHVTRDGVPRDSIVHTLDVAQWARNQGPTTAIGVR